MFQLDWSELSENGVSSVDSIGLLAPGGVDRRQVWRVIEDSGVREAGSPPASFDPQLTEITAIE